MIIRIYKGKTDNDFLLGSQDKRFAKAWGRYIIVPANKAFRQLAYVARWVYNTFEEECTFEVREHYD